MVILKLTEGDGYQGAVKERQDRQDVVKFFLANNVIIFVLLCFEKNEVSEVKHEFGFFFIYLVFPFGKVFNAIPIFKLPINFTSVLIVKERAKIQYSVSELSMRIMLSSKLQSLKCAATKF